MLELSVIIPFFNGANYIERTLESIMKISSLKEILIVDDGSDPEQGAILHEIEEKTSEVRIVGMKNGGIASARNEGLKQAVGKYIMFVDQDDIVCAQTVENALVQARGNGLDAVVWSTEIMRADGSTTSCDKVNSFKNMNEDQSHDLLKSMLLGRPSKYISKLGHVWAWLFCRDIILKNKISFQWFVNYEDDYLFVASFLASAQKICLIPDTGYYWIQNRNSESHQIRYIPGYMERYHDMKCYIQGLLDKAYFGDSEKEEFDEIQEINMILGAIINGCTVGNPSIDERKELFICAHNLNKNKMLAKYDPKDYQIGFRNRVWRIIQRKHVLLAMLYADVHSMLAYLKRKIIKQLG